MPCYAAGANSRSSVYLWTRGHVRFRGFGTRIGTGGIAERYAGLQDARRARRCGRKVLMGLSCRATPLRGWWPRQVERLKLSPGFKRAAAKLQAERRDLSQYDMWACSSMGRPSATTRS